ASSVYVDPVASGMSTHVPSSVHRCHCRVNSATPLHVPSSALRSSPVIAAPVITGELSAVGGGGAGSAGTGAVVAVTTSDAVEAASPAPKGSLAVRTIRTVEPASSSASVYVSPVAPTMSTHGSPDASQRCHCRVRSAAPLQTPSSACKVSPTTAVPVTD